MSQRLQRHIIRPSIAAMFGAMADPTGQSIEQAQNRKPTGRKRGIFNADQERRIRAAEEKRQRRAAKRIADHVKADVWRHPRLQMASYRKFVLNEIKEGRGLMPEDHRERLVESLSRAMQIPRHLL